MITDYTKEFDETFNKFQTGKLPKDDLYWKIKNELEAANKDKEKIEKKYKGKNVLPTTHPNKMEEIKSEMHKNNVERELKDMEANGEGRDFAKPLQLNLVEKIEEQKQAFTGNFSNIDDELRLQVLALNRNDLATMQKVRNGELNNAQIQFYLADVAKQKEMEMNQKGEEDMYDSDLNRSMF